MPAGTGWTSARRPKPGPPTAPLRASLRRSAAGCWSGWAVTSPWPGRRRRAAGGSGSRTSPGARRRSRTGRPRWWRSPAVAWPPPVPRHGAGGAAATCCTTSLTRAPACAGAGLADDLGHRRDVRGRQRGQHRGIIRGTGPRAGWPGSACPPGWSAWTVRWRPWPAGPLRPCQPGQARSPGEGPASRVRPGHPVRACSR